MASLLEEARALSDAGVKELIVIAQDITKYGMDLPEHKRLLPELLRELCKLDFTWIRLHYLYPDQITDELIDVIADEPKIVKYLDIPLQHVSKRILRAMHRPGDGAEFTALIEDMRRRIPGLVLRTSLIVGLPGDTYESFCDTIEQVLALDPENVTVHALALKRSSRITQSGEINRAHADAALADRMMAYAEKRLTEHGLAPYYLYRQSRMAGNLENTGWAKPGFVCAYNIFTMDETETVLACGAGGVSKLKDPYSEDLTRIFNFKYSYEYISRYGEILERKEGIGRQYEQFRKRIR